MNGGKCVLVALNGRNNTLKRQCHRFEIGNESATIFQQTVWAKKGKNKIQHSNISGKLCQKKIYRRKTRKRTFFSLWYEFLGGETQVVFCFYFGFSVFTTKQRRSYIDVLFFSSATNLTKDNVYENCENFSNYSQIEEWKYPSIYTFFFLRSASSIAFFALPPFLSSFAYRSNEMFHWKSHGIFVWLRLFAKWNDGEIRNIRSVKKR